MAEPSVPSASRASPQLPTGTVTFLFTDLEGGTRLLEAHPAAYRDTVRRHHALLRDALEANGGVVFETVLAAVHALGARLPRAACPPDTGGPSADARWRPSKIPPTRPVRASTPS